MKFWRAALMSGCVIPLIHGKAIGQTAVSAIPNNAGNWSAPGTWNPAVVPNNSAGTSYDVTINSAGVTLDQNAEVNSLSLDSNAALDATQPENLTIDTNLANAGQVTLTSGSSLLVKGNIDNSGALATFNPNAPTPGAATNITVDGTLTNGGSGNISLGGYAPDTVTVGTLINGANTVPGSPAVITVPTGATLTVKQELDLVGNSNLTVDGTLNGLGNLNQFTNTATTTPTLTLVGASVVATPLFNGNTLKIGGNLGQMNGSSLTVNGNLSTSRYYATSGGNNIIDISGAVSNSGAFHLASAGDAATFGTLQNTGIFTTASGTSLSLTKQPGGVTAIAAGSQLSVGGAFTAGGTSALANLQSVDGSLTLANGQDIVDTPGSGTLAIGANGSFTQQTGSFTVNGSLANQGNFVVDQSATITGNLSGTGVVQVASGGTLNLGQSVTTLPTGETLNVLGTLTVAGQHNLLNLQSVNGILAFANGQSQTIAPASGTLNVTNAFYVGQNTTVTVQGNLDNSAPQSASDPAFQDSAGAGASLLGTINVTGTINNTGYLFGGNINAAAINNSGAVFFDQNPPTQNGLPENITVSGAYTQTGSASQTSLLNPDEILNAKTVDIQGGSFTTYQLNANTLQIGANAQAALFETNLGGTPAAQTANPIAQTVIASNGTLVDNGSLTLNSLPTANGLTNAGSVTIGAGGVLADNAGNYVQTGGTTVVDGSLSAAGVAIDGGTLTGTGSITGDVTLAGGILRPGGDPLRIAGNLFLSPNSIYAENLAAGTAFGALDVSGTANLAGTLDLSFLGNFFPANMQQFVILHALGGLNGAFSAIQGLNFGPGGLDSWNISYANSEVLLTADALVAPVPEPASVGVFGTAVLALGMIRLPGRRLRRRGGGLGDPLGTAQNFG